MGRRYEVEIEGKRYHVEVRYPGKFSPQSGAGECWSMGKWLMGGGSSFWGLPQERIFEIAGKKAILRRRGIVLQELELFVPGTKVTKI